MSPPDRCEDRAGTGVSLRPGRPSAPSPALPTIVGVSPILVSILVVLALILVEALFVASEIALVSLREVQIETMAQQGRRGQVVARLVRDQNRWLATVQIGVTLTALLSSAYGAITLSESAKRGLIGRRAQRGPGRVRRRRRRHPGHHLRHAGDRRTRAQAAGAAAAGVHGARGRAVPVPDGLGGPALHLPALGVHQRRGAAVRRRPGRGAGGGVLGGTAAHGRRERDAEQRRARPDRRDLRRRRPAAARGAGAAHRGHVPGRGPADPAGGPARGLRAALALSGDRGLGGQRHRVRARARLPEPGAGRPLDPAGGDRPGR